MDNVRRLCLLGLATAATGGAVWRAAAAEPRVVPVLARRFTFSPNALTLRRGEPVVFELTSADVLMGFSLPDFGLRADIVPGQPTRLPFTPDRSGSFVFLCDIFCGSGHETMNGTLTVT